MRSKLFVPGSRPELFAKALASEADAISLDLEDAVVEDRKAEARAQVADFLRSDAARNSGKELVVRVNAPGTPHFEADVRAVAVQGLDLLNLPKCESAESVRLAVSALAAAEAANGVTRPARILATIESPRGLRLAAMIGASDPRVAGLQVGYLDLFEPLGIDRRDDAAVHAVMFAVRMAAGEAGVFACDGAFADVKDAEGFRAEAEMARRLGFSGKSCIHPAQVPVANKVFCPGAEEIARALRVLAAAEQARAQGRGAFAVDGEMIDAPAIRRAEAVVAISRRLASAR
ncbi:MAG: CoA ester lyase [Steroidobacteraceae bacterium]